MIEAVGLKNLDDYYDVISRVLKPNGLCLIQSITNGRTIEIQNDPWIHKYIFPNGYLPTPKLLASFSERRLVVEDMQNFGLDYVRTLLAWDKRVKKCAAAGVFDEEKQDETFLRMWEYYLLYCAAAFRARTTHVYQVVYSKRGRNEVYVAER
jgi:cyclopropane-fatty-acyl-phospholipid synthase